MHGTCARDGLYGGCALFRKSCRVSAQDELCSGRGEGCETGDGEVFVIQGGVVAEELISLGGSKQSVEARIHS